MEFRLRIRGPFRPRIPHHPYRSLCTPFATEPESKQTSHIMKSTLLVPSALAAALALSLSSCGDKDSSAGNSGKDSKPGTPESADTYPLKVCVVSGEELGSMGKPYVLDHEGTEVRFCCEDCLPKFKADPDKYLAKLKAAQPADAGPAEPNP
jgi:YHS domain-containing protein